MPKTALRAEIHIDVTKRDHRFLLPGTQFSKVTDDREHKTAEVQGQSIPLMERLKFLSIFSTNLDEFFMGRVSGIQGRLETNPDSLSPDGLTPATPRKLISERLRPLLFRTFQISVSTLEFCFARSVRATKKVLARHFGLVRNRLSQTDGA